MGQKQEPVSGFFDETSQQLVAYEGLDGHKQDMPGRGDAAISEESTNVITTENGAALKVKQLSEEVAILDAATTETTIEPPAGSIVLAVAVRVLTVIPTAADFKVGDAGDDDRYAAAVLVAAGSTDPGTLVVPYVPATAAPIVITPDMTPADATGVVRVTIFYIEITPPTS